MDEEQKVTSFEEILEQDGKLVYKTRGVSMLPMLQQNRDLVVIESVSEKLKPYDVALYRRGSQYVLHRVIGTGDGVYYIRGDNTYSIETVPEKAVLGVLTAFVHKGKQHQVTETGYRMYSRFWHKIYPVRTVLLRGKRFAVKAVKKTGAAPYIKKALRGN